MNVMTATSLPSSISETSSILSSISSCCSHTHDTTTTNNITNLDIDPNNNNNNNNNLGSNNNNAIQQTSLQFILNQNNNDPLDYWEFNDYSEEEDEEFNDNNYYYYDSCYPDSHFDPSQQFNSEYYNQYTSQNFQNQYSSNGKLVPPPSPPIEMDLLEDNQILSPDEFNSIFESFTAVVEGYSDHNNNNNLSNNNFIEDGCLRSVNCSNGFLDDEQLSQALGAIAMI